MPARVSDVPSRAVRTFVLARGGVKDVLGVGATFGQQPIGRHIDPQGLAGYYCDLRHKAHAASAAPGAFTGEVGVRSSPVSPWIIPVAQAALGYWELTLEGHQVHHEFLRLADWLVENADRGAHGAQWLTDLPVDKYGIRGPWASAMGQGEAISVLLRAHALTGGDRYGQLAHDALGPMLADVAAGGVARRVDGHLVLEEYPADRPAAVLNGWAFALFGVHELAVAGGDPRARALFAESLDGLLALLHRYDVGWWSRYSLYPHAGPDLSRPFYQRLHAVVLRALHLVADDPRLLAMAERFEAQYTRPALARVVANKLAFRIGGGRRLVADTPVPAPPARAQADRHPAAAPSPVAPGDRAALDVPLRRAT